MKTITIGFQVPEDSDWPSERLALAKHLMLEHLEKAQRSGAFVGTKFAQGAWTKASENAYADECGVANDLLTES